MIELICLYLSMTLFTLILWFFTVRYSIRVKGMYFDADMVIMLLIAFLPFVSIITMFTCVVIVCGSLPFDKITNWFRK